MKRGKSVTIRDVAEAANVSRTLVSFVLNGRTDVASQTRERILQAIEELGYRPSRLARNLARKSSGAVGLVLPFGHPDALTMQILGALLDAMAGTQLRLMVLRADYRDLLEALDEQTVDALFFTDIDSRNPELARLHEHSVSTASIWDFLTEQALADGFSQLAQHLSIRGHNEVVVAATGEHLTGIMRPTLTDVFQRSGVTILDWHYGASTEERAMQAVEAMIDTTRASAIVTLSDAIALGIVQGLRHRRLRIPEDIAVTGFGDIPNARWSVPSLTTIRVPFDDLAKNAIMSLSDDHHQVPACRLIVRRSC